MKICRYNDNQIGVVKGELVYDATSALESLPSVRWPFPLGDQLVENLAALVPEIEAAASRSEPVNIADIKLLSPVANPSKIVAAPVNYKNHVDESLLDEGINFNQTILPIEKAGVFLKANSSLVGPSEGVAIRFPELRNDHEVELVVIIGKAASRVSRDEAMEYVAGYCIGLDISVRGTQARSYRKSPDTYTVLGPWLVTADEIEDANNLDFNLTVNGETRQQANTRDLIFDIARIIEHASEVYTLLPGDIIMTGTPEGVNKLVAGDQMVATIERIGSMTVDVRNG